MDKVKKRLNKTSQLLSEKVGGNKGTQLEEEIQELWRKAEIMGTSVDKVIDKTKAFLRPNPAERRKYYLHTSYHKAVGDAETHKYSQPEHRLAEAVKKFGTELNSPDAVGGDSTHMGSAYASSLVELGEALEQIADAKETLDARVRQNFLHPLNGILEKDVKDIHHHKKKMESRRLDYDYKESKGEKFSADDLAEAESKYLESKELYYEHLVELVENSDAEHVQQLNALAELLKEYHQQCGQIMSQVTELLERMRDEATSGDAHGRSSWQQQRLAVPNNGSRSNRSSAEISDDESRLAVSSPAPAQPTGPYGGSSPYDSRLPVSSPAPPARTSREVRVPHCRGLYDFDAETDEDLEFHEGDVITLLSKVDDNWWYGSFNGKEGCFPDSYVEIIVPL